MTLYELSLTKNVQISFEDNGFLKKTFQVY